jgi:MarR family transcriptional regulator, organic hydroperoxide resistance regulator
MPRKSSARPSEAAETFTAPELMFEQLDGLLGYCLRRAQGAMHRDFMAAVSELELTQKQTATLWLISANPGVSQVSVAAALDMDRATMMSITDRLEERGLVIRKRSSVDRRRQELYLTPAGIARLRKVKTRIAEHEARVKALFKPSELAALVDALKKFQDLG